MFENPNGIVCINNTQQNITALLLAMNIFQYELMVLFRCQVTITDILQLQTWDKVTVQVCIGKEFSYIQEMSAASLYHQFCLLTRYKEFWAIHLTTKGTHYVR